MNTVLKTTNWLTSDTFYNDFLDWLVRLEPFVTDDGKPPMSANQFYWCARIQYGCGLRISEALKLTPKDFDLDHRILTIQNPKTAKGKFQKTTIMPYDVPPLYKFLNKFSIDEKLFPTTRSTMWKYYKNASILGGIRLFEAKENIDIEGAWTHLMRSSCAKLYRSQGATEELVAKKLRHSARTVTQIYTKIDLNTLLDWEAEHLHEIPFFEKVIQN